LARTLIKPAVKALASAGLRFAAEKTLKKIFINGYGAIEIKLYKLVQAVSLQNIKRLLKTILLVKAWFAAAEQRSTADFLEYWRLQACLSPLT